MTIQRITDEDVAAAWAVVDTWSERINDPTQPMTAALPLLRNLVTEAVAAGRATTPTVMALEHIPSNDLAREWLRRYDAPSGRLRELDEM